MRMHRSGTALFRHDIHLSWPKPARVLLNNYNTASLQAYVVALFCKGAKLLNLQPSGTLDVY